MSLFKEFSQLLPYLQSVRKLEKYLSFDVQFPKTWKILKKYVNEEKVLQQESKNTEERLFSFVSEINEEDVNLTIDNIKNIISYNLELEMKEKLFDDKVNELKNIFEKQNLNSLKNLQFQIPKNKIKLSDDEEPIQSEVVSE
jgi:cysteinyl-tRNA synthetase